MAGVRPGRLTTVLFALLALPVAMSMIAPAVAGQDAVLDALDSCARKLNPEIDIGYGRIAARCPELVRRLRESGWSVWLPQDWKQPGNDLSAGGLRELRELLSRPPTGGGRAPAVASLQGVLAGLTQKGSERSGWWARTKAWLRDAFERREQGDDEGWLTRLVGQDRLSEAVIELISYGALTLVVLLAGVIVVNELRVGGVFGALLDVGRARLATRRAPPTADMQRGGSIWADVQKGSPSQRPRLLLELIVARLTEESRLPPARGLTVRELTRAARLPDAGDRDRLAELARMSERVRFSNTAVSNDAIAVAVEGGRVLLERISPQAVDSPGGPVSPS